MNRCYVVYTKYEKDMILLNNLENEIEINKVFINQNVTLYAQSYVKSELQFQCDRIIFPNGKIWQRADKKEKIEWVAKLKEKEQCLIAEVYYNNELQYTIYIVETEVM